MGQGLPVPAPGMTPWANLFNPPSWAGDDAGTELARDWYLGGLAPPDPIEIPWSWLAPILRFRQDKAVTYAAVTRTAGGTAVSSVDMDEQIDFTATLDTANNVDAPNLAHFMTVYYDEPRTRLAQLRFILNNRTVTEIWTLLGADIGDRILLTDLPATGWPAGADSVVIEGIFHSITSEERVVEWSTSPVIGETAGTVGPFFRVGVSLLDGSDLLPW